MWESRKETIPYALEALSKAGYKFVSVSQCLGIQPYQVSHDPPYGCGVTNPSQLSSLFKHQESVTRPGLAAPQHLLLRLSLLLLLREVLMTTRGSPPT